MQLVAAYLMTCRSANWLGLYYLPLPTLCHELNLTLEGASKALRRVSEAEFGYYDTLTEHVWVPEMARHQIGGQLAPGDNRITGIIKDLETFRKTPFFNAFLEKYGSAFHLENVAFSEAPPKPLPSPSEAPSKPGAGAGAVTGTQKDEDSGEAPPAPPATAPPPVLDPVVFSFPVIGPADKPKEWNLFQAKLREYQETFTGVDVMTQCRAARQWCVDNPQRRKTAGGMPAFLSRWLSKEQNRGGVIKDRTMAIRATMTPNTEKVIRAFKIAKGFKDDVNWNELVGVKFIQPANQLIAYFGGDWQMAIRCIEEVSNTMSDQFPIGDGTRSLSGRRNLNGRWRHDGFHRYPGNGYRQTQIRPNPDFTSL